MLIAHCISLMSGRALLNNPGFYRCRYAAYLLAACCFICTGCSDVSQPPYITAQVFDVYNNKTTIYNTHFKYVWQERGDTAFLDSYSRTDKLLMVSATSVKADGKANSTYSPLHIQLEDIQRIEWVLTKTEKKMLVYGTNGSVFEAKCLFPQILRVDSESGLADYSCFIVGSTSKDSPDFDYEQSLDFIKTITVTAVSDTL